MQAVKNSNQPLSLDDHKRKLFFESLSSDTTSDSLEKYLSGYELERCVVPQKDGMNNILFRLKLRHIQLVVF